MGKFRRDIMSEITNYGVLVDFHAARRAEGVPTYWDGWYSEEEDALEAAKQMRWKHPGARVYLVRTEDAGRTISDRWTSCTVHIAEAHLGGPAVTGLITR